MLNSEKMVASIGNQDLDHADKYFKKALREDPAEHENPGVYLSDDQPAHYP